MINKKIQEVIVKLMHWSIIVGQYEDCKEIQSYAMMKISETFKLNNLDWDEMFDDLDKEMSEFKKMFFDQDDSNKEAKCKT